MPRESRMSGVAATRFTAVPCDNVVTGSFPSPIHSRYFFPLDHAPFGRLMTRKHDWRDSR